MITLLGQLQVVAFLVASAVAAASDSAAFAAWYPAVAAPVTLLLSVVSMRLIVRANQPIIIVGREDLLKRPHEPPPTTAVPVIKSHKEITFRNEIPMIVISFNEFKLVGKIPRSDEASTREVRMQLGADGKQEVADIVIYVR